MQTMSIPETTASLLAIITVLLVSRKLKRYLVTLISVRKRHV